MRLFVAIELTDALRERAASLMHLLRPLVSGARWVSPGNLHLTLRFLGECNVIRTGAIRRELREIAGNHRAFSACYQGLGGFPKPRRARVLWVGMRPMPVPLGRLQRDVERAVERAGMAPEPRPFDAHLTMARFRQPRDLTPTLERFGEHRLGEDPVTRFVLYQSHLGRAGATHDVVEPFSLASSEARA